MKRIVLTLFLCASPAYSDDAAFRLARRLYNNEQPQPIAPVSISTDYDAMTSICAHQKKPLVVFSNTPARQIAGLAVCQSKLPETGIIIGIPANGWLDRYDLPADVSDDAIRAFIQSKMTTFGRREVRQQETSAMPQPFRQPLVFRGGGRGGASC